MHNCHNVCSQDKQEHLQLYVQHVSEMETEIPALVEVMVREILMGQKRL